MTRRTPEDVADLLRRVEELREQVRQQQDQIDKLAQAAQRLSRSRSDTQG